MIDLHVHSTFSDGTCTPTELIELAQKAGVAVLALCDHNTVAGLPEFLTAAQGSGVNAVPGVEFSTEYNGIELHILGLFIPPEHYSDIAALLNDALARKERSNRELVLALSEAGLKMDYDLIRAANPDGMINRAVIGAEMVRLGYVSSVQEAFSQWLGEKHGFYRPARRPDSLEIIRFIRSIGCVSVLAHPFLDLDEAGLRNFLNEAVESGLDGMETCYAGFDRETTELARKITGEYGLLESGGSDFHGANKPDIQIGTGRGTLCVPEEFFAALEERNRRRKTNF